MSFFANLKQLLLQMFSNRRDGGQTAAIRNSTNPNVRTDDLNLPLSSRRTVDEITAFVIEQARAKVDWEDLTKAIEETFGLSPDDAELVYDRVCGGVVRASTGNIDNQPDPVYDPFAYASFQRALRDPSVITALQR